MNLTVDLFFILLQDGIKTNRDKCLSLFCDIFIDFFFTASGQSPPARHRPLPEYDPPGEVW